MALSYHHNSLINAIKTSDEAVNNLLNSMPSPWVFEGVQNDLNVLMLAVCFRPKLIPKLVTAIPKELKKTVFEHVNSVGENALMYALYNNCDINIITSLINAIPQESKLKVLGQVTRFGHSTISYAKDKAIALVLDAMPIDLKKKTFEQEDKWWFGSNLNIMTNLLQSKHTIQSVLTLLSEGVLSRYGKSFKQIVTHKEKLLNHILTLDINERYLLLKEIHENKKGSHLAMVFHTSRHIFKPQITKGILGQAEKAYQELHALLNVKPTTSYQGILPKLVNTTTDAPLYPSLDIPSSRPDTPVVTNNPPRSITLSIDEMIDFLPRYDDQAIRFS